MEKAKDTLSHAKIKIRGFPSSLMDPILELPCQGQKIHLRLFNLKNEREVGMLSRSVAEEDEDDDVEFPRVKLV